VLKDVLGYVLVEPGEAQPILDTLRAFGGKHVTDIDDATHVIVPDNLSPHLQRLRSDLEVSLAMGKPVVGVSWLEDVVTATGSSPLDQNLIDSHVPAALADLGVAPAALPPPFVGSLQETWGFLVREHPEDVEAGHMRRAIEQSLLDSAITLRKDRRGESQNSRQEAPEKVLGVAMGAKLEEVRAAYKEKARLSHPDRGGSPEAFCRLQQAYLALTTEQASGSQGSGNGPLLALPSPEDRDFDLKEHRALIESWFEKHGEDLAQHVERQELVLEGLGLEVFDVGSCNRNERGEEMRNQCFYLSLARSYLGSNYKQQLLEETALHFKRVVEAAVLVAHPDWGGSRVGEHVQAFSDFLFFVLDSRGLLSELVIVIFDSVSGGVEIYRGKHYPGPERDEEQRANLLTIKYVPGHYQALGRPAECGHRGPTLAELQQRLDEYSVLYVITDG